MNLSYTYNCTYIYTYTYCTGGDLEKLMKGDGKLTEASVRDFGYDMLSGLKVSYYISLLSNIMALHLTHYA